MRNKKSLFLTGLAAVALAAGAQADVVVDGVLSDQDGYSLVASWTQVDTGFGDHGIREIHTSYDADSFNVFIVGNPEENFNATMLFLDSVPGDGQATLPTGSDGGPFGGIDGTILEFAADHATRLSWGNGNETYFSTIDYTSGGNTDTFLGQPGLGNALTVSGGPYDGAVFAYNDGSGNLSTNDGTTGIEISYPYSVIGADPTDDISVFAVYANGGGDFLSANTVPEVPGQSGTNLGADPDFTGLAGTQAAAATSSILDVFTFEVDQSGSFSTILSDSTANFTDEVETSLGIPDAPRSAALDSLTSNALTFTVNSAGVSTAGNAFTNSTYSGNYKMTVDVYGNIGGGGGSTIYAQTGINQSGTNGISFNQDGAPVEFGVGTDGYWYQQTIDGGSSRDHVFKDGSPAATALTSSGLFWGDGLEGDGTVVDADRNNSDAFINTEILSPGGTIQGVWATVELISDNGYIIANVDGNQLFSYQDSDSDVWTTGSVLLGAEDTFGSVSSSHTVVFDNLVVSQITTSIPPSAGTVDSVVTNADDTDASLSWDGFTDADTGIVAYEVSIDGGVLAPTNVGGVESFDVSNPAPGNYLISVSGIDSSGTSVTATANLEVLDNSDVMDWTTLNLD